MDRLEHKTNEDRHTIMAGLGAHAFAISLLHRDVAQLRGEFTEFREGMNGFREDMNGFRDETRTELAGIKSTLDEVLARLPERPAASP
jgi:hypothetical protein